MKSELSGTFEKIMVALCLPVADFMAREMYEAVNGMGTKEGTLVEILCSGTNQEIREINAAYLRCEYFCTLLLLLLSLAILIVCC